MHTLKNMNLGARLGLGFAAVILLLIAIAAIGITRINAVSQLTDVIVQDRYATIAIGHRLASGIHRQATDLRNVLVANDPKQFSDELADIDATTAALTKTLAELQAMIRTEQGQRLFKQVLDTRVRFTAAGNELVRMVKEGQNREGREFIFDGLRGPQQDYIAAVTQLNDFYAGLMDASSKDASAGARSANLLLSMLALLSVVLAGSAGFGLTRSVTGPISTAVRVAQSVAAGDLTSKIDAQGSNETGQLLNALKAMNASLVGIVGQVRASSDSIASGSAQIATGNANLSERTDEQAVQLQQTAASMEQLTQTVRQNADTARQANQLAGSASAAAAKGGRVVDQVVGTMNDITASSKKIADIVGVIDGIAFQTNILALNAAVEAARAGDQGRGFAVVASEVRSLAQRSAEAAREIKALIGASVEKVQIGSRLVGEAGQSMADIVAQVQRVTDLIGEISAASAEQTKGISQVGAAVAQLDQVTQQNAALVEQSATSADSLKDQAARLAQAVGTFRLNAAVPV